MPNSIAIALAWPETRCKQTGAWYDKPAEFLGISKNHYYKVGHSAIVLINPETKQCHYFDFGRYHAPKGYGRVRDEVTDHDLKIYTKADLSDSLELINYQEIIDEIQSKPSCHGNGQLFAGLIQINFEKALRRCKYLQDQDFIEYGPFVLNGTNCSRFVRSVLFNAVSSKFLKLKLTFTRTLSPTPIGIVKNLKSQRKAKLFNKEIETQENIEQCKILTT
ncbi:DUF6695 family protein [Mesohalobacter halotolerans]|uniref:Type VI secretion system effector TseH-like domain-containing protein n=1 Tax=Mesohalobacter halotolerans TaxID=1883405 RepID=A0A4U5TRQ2_9FLAO|nr:DUF6695 family protein [Mesohalobacter halotolerans]MBS3739267.1 hypothetical protein [Psychroflexus sp.]TKS56682.1 hypothetical protein FCN74_06535 [Mesohalobacter halotolerans]